MTARHSWLAIFRMQSVVLHPNRPPPRWLVTSDRRPRRGFAVALTKQPRCDPRAWERLLCCLTSPRPVGVLRHPGFSLRERMSLTFRAYSDRRGRGILWGRGVPVMAVRVRRARFPLDARGISMGGAAPTVAVGYDCGPRAIETEFSRRERNLINQKGRVLMNIQVSLDLGARLRGGTRTVGPMALVGPARFALKHHLTGSSGRPSCFSLFTVCPWSRCKFIFGIPLRDVARITALWGRRTQYSSQHCRPFPSPFVWLASTDGQAAAKLVFAPAHSSFGFLSPS